MRLTPGDAQRYAALYAQERAEATRYVPWFDLLYVLRRWGVR